MMAFISSTPLRVLDISALDKTAQPFRVEGAGDMQLCTKKCGGSMPEQLLATFDTTLALKVESLPVIIPVTIGVGQLPSGERNYWLQPHAEKCQKKDSCWGCHDYFLDCKVSDTRPMLKFGYNTVGNYFKVWYEPNNEMTTFWNIFEPIM